MSFVLPASQERVYDRIVHLTIWWALAKRTVQPLPCDICGEFIAGGNLRHLKAAHPKAHRIMLVFLISPFVIAAAVPMSFLELFRLVPGIAPKDPLLEVLMLVFFGIAAGGIEVFIFTAFLLTKKFESLRKEWVEAHPGMDVGALEAVLNPRRLPPPAEGAPDAVLGPVGRPSVWRMFRRDPHAFMLGSLFLLTTAGTVAVYLVPKIQSNSDLTFSTEELEFILFFVACAIVAIVPRLLYVSSIFRNGARVRASVADRRRLWSRFRVAEEDRLFVYRFNGQVYEEWGTVYVGAETPPKVGDVAVLVVDERKPTRFLHLDSYN